LQKRIHAVQELFAVVVIVLPGVLAVEDDADQVRAGGPLLLQLGADGQDALDQVSGSRLAGVPL